MARPSKYDPAYCDEVLDDARQGLSLTAFAGKIGVDRDTISEWAKVHPEFSVAVKRHKAIRARTLEIGLLNPDASGPNVTSRIFALKNAAPEDWKELSRVETTGKDGGPIQTETTVDISNATSDQLRALASLPVKGK